MPKYKLSVDETVNTMKFLEIETDLSEIELDALLTKIEQNEITRTAVLIKKLEAHNVNVTNATSSSQSYYSNAVTLEIEGLEG